MSSNNVSFCRDKKYRDIRYHLPRNRDSKEMVSQKLLIVHLMWCLKRKCDVKNKDSDDANSVSMSFLSFLFWRAHLSKQIDSLQNKYYIINLTLKNTREENAAVDLWRSLCSPTHGLINSELSTASLNKYSSPTNTSTPPWRASERALILELMVDLSSEFHFNF